MYYKTPLILAVIVPSLFGDVVNISPTALDFGSNPIGVTSANSVTLSNPTKKVLNISSITASGDFSSSANTCGGALAAGQQCAITVAFAPTTLGTRTGMLSITDDAGDGTQKVKLSGIGTPAIVTSVSVSPVQSTVIKGQTRQLIAVAHFSDGTVTDVSGSAQWSSSALGVATVSPTGLVMAAGQGTATIQAAYNSVTGGAIVNVPQPVLTRVVVLPPWVFVSPGIPTQFSALGIYDNGASRQDITSSITNWISSNPAICTVDAKGVAICSGLGRVGISIPANYAATLDSSIQELYHGMNSPRYGHTSTLLAGGRVLLAGGSSQVSPAGQSSAELYDPSTGGFVATGSMTTPRFRHTASTIPIGAKVLIAGGDSNGLTTEIYDQTSGTFTPAASFNVPRQGHTATDFLTGKLLIAGGYTATAELYDYDAGTFTMTGSMAQDRHDHTATQIGFTVLIAGGIGSDGTYLSSAELYDSATGTFSALPPMSTARAYHTATPLGDGRILIAGGYDGTASLSSTEIYDSATRTFSPGPNLSVARASHTATRYVQSNIWFVFFAGGENQTGIVTSGEIMLGSSPSIEIGNLATPNFGGYRAVHAATLLENNQILITGGYPGSPNTQIGELFIPQH